MFGIIIKNIQIRMNIYIHKYLVLNYLFQNTKNHYLDLKFIEINSIFSLCEQPYPIKTFGISEGPGGFIEALTTIRDNPDDMYYGMTLINDDENTPGWKKAQRFLKQNTNVYIETGETHDGNILNLDNYYHCAKQHENKFDIITGDGGFDFSQDFNNQENLCSKLIVAQALYAITQKRQGTFVLKVFDIFYKSTLDILYFKYVLQ